MAKYWVTSADPGWSGVSGQNGALTTLAAALAANAGLSVPYTGTNKCVIQTPTGSVLRLVHDSSVSGDARLCTARAAESASAIDTIADPYPQVGLVADNACTVALSSTANSTLRPWWSLIDTTKRCIYLLVDTASAGAITGGLIWFQGDRIFPSDPYAEFTFVRSATSATSAIPPFEAFANTPAATANLWAMRTKDGVTKSVRCQYGPRSDVAYPSGGTYAQAAPSIDGDMRLDRIFVGDNGSQSATPDTARSEVKRAYVPNVFLPQHSHNTYSAYTCGEVFNVASYDPDIDLAFFPFTSAAGGRGAIVLEISDPP